MDNARKYEIPEEEVLMAKEAEAAYAITAPAYAMCVASRNTDPTTSTNESVARILARTPEEFEDMRRHDFYAKGTPFPQQPQTWDEVWEELDNQEEEIYLDEAEANKAIERLWSVLA